MPCGIPAATPGTKGGSDCGDPITGGVTSTLAIFHPTLEATYAGGWSVCGLAPVQGQGLNAMSPKRINWLVPPPTPPHQYRKETVVSGPL